MQLLTLTGRAGKGIIILLLLTGLSLTTFAQMKIGNHPTQIHPASILELESPNQALRLTQGDTASVNNTIGNETGVTDIHDTTQAGVKAAEGMIMYQNSDHSLYVRVAGYWRQIVSSAVVDSTFWKLGGNPGTDSSFIGTTDNEPLTIGTNSQGYIIIHGDGTMEILSDSSHFGGEVTIADSLNVNNGALKLSDSLYVNTAMAIHDSIVITGLKNALPSDSAVLVLGSNGVVRKMSLDNLGIRSVNGVGGPLLHLKFDTATLGHFGPWIDSTSGLDSSYLILNIPDASPTVRGLVNNSTQAFGGAKSFSDSVALGTTGTPGATLDVHGNVNLKTIYINTGPTYDMTSESKDTVKTIIIDVAAMPTGDFTLTLPTISTEINGRVYTIKKIGDVDDNQIDRTVKIIPSASQTFGDGGTSFTIYNNFTSVSLQAMNDKWFVVSH